jgi:hypothetical protein
MKRMWNISRKYSTIHQERIRKTTIKVGQIRRFVDLANCFVTVIVFVRKFMLILHLLCSRQTYMYLFFMCVWFYFTFYSFVYAHSVIGSCS